MSRPSRFSLFSPSAFSLPAISASRYRPLTASAALFFFMSSQVVLPAVVAIDVAQADTRQPQSQKAAAPVTVEASSTDSNATATKPKWSKGYQALLDKNAEKWRVVQAQLRNNTPKNNTAKPNWNRNQVARTAPLIRVPSSKPGQVVVSQDNGACEDCVVDVRALDLSKVPTERDLRRAGQFGGALSPTRPAEPREVEARLDEILKKFGVAEGLKANLPKLTRGGLLVELARKKAQRAKDINLDFGNAMQEWNKHNYRVAAKMLEKHIEAYPESPWIGEAELHLGCDAKYNGRFAEAQERYESLLKATSEKPNREGDAQRLMRSQTPQIATQRMERDVKEIIANSANPEAAIENADEKTDLSFDIHQKAKLRWADLDLAMGRFDNAAQKLGNIIRTDTDWRRVTWAQSWLHTTNFYKKNAKRLMACGPQALGFVMVAANRKQGADQVIKAVSPRDTGFNLAELQTLAKKNGLTMRGFQVSVKELDALTLPAILHYDFGTQPKASKGVGDERGSQSPFRAVGQNGTGHFVVLQKVDAKAGTVRLFDPLEKRFYTLTYAQLKRQWSGKGLMLDVQKGDGQKNNELKNRGQQTQIARLETRSMKAAVGGCCGIASAPDDLGDSPNNQECKTCGAGGGTNMTKFGGGGGASGSGGGAMMIRAFSDQGEPVVEFNRSTLNMYVHDTPLWYQPAKGPAVGITISYNSRDGLNQNVAFGNKWAFRYGSYVVEDTAGRVTAFMEDGSQDNYTPNGSGGYNREVGNFTQLQKVSGTKYILHFQDGSQYVYEVPSGTTSLQVFLKEIIDPFGYKLTFTYNSSVQLTKITDALGQETSLVYDSNGKVTQVWDPFGRHASFSYNTGGNLIECIDMEGQAFQYTYDSVVRMTQINTAQGPWKFKHEGPDGIDNGFIDYPAEDGVMWENIRVTVTNPANNKEEYYYDGYHGNAWYVNQNNYRPINAALNNSDGYDENGFNEVREVYEFTAIDGMGNNGMTANAPSGRISSTTYPDGTSTIPSSVVYTQYDRDNNGYPLSVSQALPTKFYDARGKATFTTYNAQGQPLTVKDPKGNVTTLTYATNGLDVASVTNANSQTVATYTYNTKHQVLTATDRSGTTTYTYEAWGAPSTVTDPQSHVTAYFYNSLGQLTEVKRDGVRQGTFTYDTVGRVKTVTGVVDPSDLSKNLTFGYQYNNLDAVTKVTYPDGTTAETEFTCCGIPGVVKDRSGRKSYYDYDVLKRPIRVQDSQGNTLKMDYDKVGNLVRLLDSKGNVTRWTYDKINQLTAKLYHDNTGESYSYYQGLLSRTQTIRGKVVSYGYDDNSNLISIDYASSSMADISLAYNALDQVTQIIDGVGTHSFSYDNYGRLNGVDGPFTNDAQSFAFDTYGRLQSQNVERGASGSTQTQSYAYDTLQRLSTLTSSGTQGSGIFTYNYQGQTDSLAQLLLPNGAQVDYSYDALQRLTRVNNHNGNTNLADYKYSYDKRDIITEAVSKLGADPLKQTNYTYDSVNQLVGEVATGGATGEAYSNAFLYDAMGNRTRLDNVKPGTTTINKTAANALNQWAGVSTSVNGGTVQSSTFTHDASGNLSQVVAADSTKTLYSYDDLERLVSIEKRTAADVPVSKSEFLYDYASRKAKSKESNWNGTAWTTTDETWRVFDGLEVIQERNADNTIRAQYVRDGNTGGIRSRTSASGHAYFHYDGNGNVTAISDSTGASAGNYSYDAFGKTLGVTGTNITLALENPYRFSTKEYHAASGLYDYGYRFYSPGMGRWINRDPIQEDGGINLYQMVGNNPVNDVDLHGLQSGGIDSDGDGVADYADDDDNNDGMRDEVVGVGGNGGNSVVNVSKGRGGSGGGIGGFFRGIMAACRNAFASANPNPTARRAGGVPKRRPVQQTQQPQQQAERPRRERRRDPRTNNYLPIGLRHTMSSAKRAYEAAKRASNGREPILEQDANGWHYHKVGPDGRRIDNDHEHWFFPGNPR